MDNNYVKNVKIIIKESFGYEFYELESTLSKNEFIVDLFQTMVLLMNKFSSNIMSRNSSYLQSNAMLRNIYAITTFMIKMSEIYNIEMIKNARFIIGNKVVMPFLVSDENKTKKSLYHHFIETEKDYKYTPFQYVVKTACKDKDVLFIYETILCLNQLAKSEISSNCITCDKFRYLKMCNCKYNINNT